MFHVIPVEIIQGNRQKSTYFGSIRGQKGAKNLARRGHLTHTHNKKYLQYASKPCFRVWHKKLFEKIIFIHLTH